MPRLETSGHKRFWPCKEHQGKDADGAIIYKEVYRDMLTGESHSPTDSDGIEIGWKGSPPSAPNTAMVASQAYRRGYENIQWETSK